MRCSCTGLLAALALAGCAANCLRDSDCGDGHVCRQDRCELLGGPAPDAGVGNAGHAGVAALGPSTSSGAGASSGGAGGSASVTDTSSGGTATGGRENLDASGG